MTDWFATRTPRERILIIGAFATLVLTVTLIGYGQLSDIHSQKRAELKRAAQTLDRITSAQPAALTQTVSGPKLDSDDLRRSILATASTRGLTVAEVRVEAGKHITVQLDEANADMIFAWLVDLETKSGAQISDAAMTEVGGGLVRSRFEFALAPTS